MNNGCVNLRWRTKKGIKYMFCIHKKAEIERNECSGCLYREYKTASKKCLKTRIKPISKKRVCVSKKTYEIVLENSKDKFGVPRCELCGCADNLQLHHILYRSERKDLIDEPSNCMMLCHKDFSQNKCHAAVHENKKKYQPILLDIKKETSNVTR
jgi:hypothetical protein